jgi:hypothetical protein
MKIKRFKKNGTPFPLGINPRDECFLGISALDGATDFRPTGHPWRIVR